MRKSPSPLLYSLPFLSLLASLVVSPRPVMADKQPVRVIKTSSLPVKQRLQMFSQGYSKLTRTNDLKKRGQLIANLAKSLGLQSFQARVSCITIDSLSRYSVQVDPLPNGSIPNEGLTLWPDWAVPTARDALLNNKLVLVVYDGSPIGSNLQQVWIMNATLPPVLVSP